jgi:hypothetical protein
LQTQLASVKEVMNIENEIVIALVLGVATLIVALLGLVVKLIELSRK